MTKEEAIKYLEKRKEKALMLMEKSKADTPINNKVRGILTRKIEVLDMAISALSEELSEDGTLTVHVSDGSKVNRVFVMGDNIFGGLYYPDSAENEGDTVSRVAYEQIMWERDIAVKQLKELGYGLGEKPEEGAELIDRRQIKWYGCDHEGHIKGINCDTADCSKCFFATVEHDEVMSLPVYRIPDSAENKGEWIPVSERLPEEDKEVLIFTKDKEINKAYHTLKEWSDTQWEWFVFGTLGYSLTYSDDEVLAWQPLPEPYKAESEDKE